MRFGRLYWPLECCEERGPNVVDGAELPPGVAQFDKRNGVFVFW
jgi:hypothetical protein